MENENCNYRLRYNIPGLLAHESALKGGACMDVPDLGNPPEDLEVLELE